MARVYSRSKPRRCTFCWDFDPGCVVTTAMSQPAAAASASRADSSAVWTPWRRCAGAVVAPMSCAMPSAMQKLAEPAGDRLVGGRGCAASAVEDPGGRPRCDGGTPAPGAADRSRSLATTAGYDEGEGV